MFLCLHFRIYYTCISLLDTRLLQLDTRLSLLDTRHLQLDTRLS